MLWLDSAGIFWNNFFSTTFWSSIHIISELEGTYFDLVNVISMAILICPLSMIWLNKLDNHLHIFNEGIISY